MADYLPIEELATSGLIVCTDCGAVVHPNYRGKHDIEHEWSENIAGRVDQMDGIG